MFTGIIEEVGKVSSIRTEDASIRLQIQTKEILKDIHIGDSIAVNGICLTVTKYDTDSFCADVMHETMNRTSLKLLRRGSKVNLERAMAANGRFGGHIVSGHIDGTGPIRKMQRDSIAIWYTIETTAGILHYIVEKGSITIDGISLTVAAVDDKTFQVSVIPHTLSHTALQEKKVDVTYADLEVDSPYNTYKYTGLPIGPVSAVSSRGMDDTLNYEGSDYLYFFAKEDGTVIYSKTYDEHEQAVSENLWY